MKKRFVIGVNSVTEGQEKAILNYLKTNNLAWWHWIDNFWLVVDRSGKFTSNILRDKLRVITKEETLLVLDVSAPGKWSGLGPSDDERNMFNWLHKTWSRR